MFQTHLILTETFLDLEQVNKDLAIHFLQSGNIYGFWQKKYTNYQELWLESLQTGRVIVSNLQNKEDYRQELMNFYQKYTQPCLLFLGDLRTLSLNLQESMLKLLEEPPNNLQIILYSHTLSQVLPTILSRCRILLLPKDYILQRLDHKLLKQVQEKLPASKIFLKHWLQKKTQTLLQNLDWQKLEREEISFWLWQLASQLQALYKQHPGQKLLAQMLDKVIRASKLNENNLQKKLVLGYLDL